MQYKERIMNSSSFKSRIKPKIKGKGSSLAAMNGVGDYRLVSLMSDDHIVNLMSHWVDSLDRMYRLSQFTENSQTEYIILMIEDAIKQLDQVLISREK